MSRLNLLLNILTALQSYVEKLITFPLTFRADKLRVSVIPLN